MAVAPTIAAHPNVQVSLYVGDLHPDVNEGVLAEVFSKFDGLASVRVCREAYTGCSLCYGYVNYVNDMEAIRAIAMMNHTFLYGKQIRVTLSNRDPDSRNGRANVFVKNLSESIDNVGLQELFKKFGYILSCKVATSEDGKSRGYGFVQFESEESVNAAIANLNGCTIGDKQICVTNFVRKTDRMLSNPDAKYTNLYMKNVDPAVGEEILQEKFSEFGKIISFAIASDGNGTSRGFGFVNFENPDDARRALEAMDGKQLGSKVLYVARAQKKAERKQILRLEFEEKRREQIMKYKESNIYVKNIDDDVTEEELREHFSQCGTITSAKIMRDDKGLSKGFGFVCFSTPEEAFKAVNTFHGFMFHKKPLYVAIAQRKEDRRTQLQLLYAQRTAAGLSPPPTSVIPGTFPSFYYPPASVTNVPHRTELMYQSLGMRPEWRANGFASPTRAVFQPSPIPAANTPRPQRQNRGRMNGNAHLRVPNTPQGAQSTNYSKERNGQAKYVPNGRQREVNRGSGANSVGVGPQVSEMLSSMLAAATPDHQKHMIGERLYPLVHKHKPELAGKITGMLLEMDNSELLLLLESPDSFNAKVEEAVEVLKMSDTTKVEGGLHQNFLSAEVQVN
ncbi:hypothetical protein UlMin_005672 [Ulmus minor]